MPSSLSARDAIHLTRALDIAAEAAAFASPNPTVGCVLTHDDISIGEGAHIYDARDHAEIAALKHAVSHSYSAEGATAYVTLEPCSHHGRTGPCADALIAAGISRCVIATVDPNPLVSGQGLAKLRAASIDTVVLDAADPLAVRARRLNDAFAFSIQHHRPFVTLKAAVSVDGMLAPPASARTFNSPHWLTGAAARADAQLLRHTSDAILVGIGTVLADNPSLTDRTGLPRRRPLLRVVLDTHLRTPLDSTLVTTAEDDVVLLASQTAPVASAEALTEAGVEVFRLPRSLRDPDAALDLHAALARLASRHVTSLLVEAGSAVNGALLRSGLVDRAVLYFAERELGVDAIPFAAGFPSPYVLQERLTSVTRETFPSNLPGATEDVRVAGYLHDPWAGTS
jgi:diaminohydroxyphosphoribosylaminopyrimidine deaminase/5-amino-6-(5-phosphoribosylamino)uracil reductase